MASYDSVLTKNLRNWVYLDHNNRLGRKVANSKLKTKKVLAKHEVSVPKLLAVFKSQKKVLQFPWENLEGNFAVKPVSSSGGEGIWVVRKRAKWAGEWFLMDGKKVNVSDLRFHCLEILQGRFNVRKAPDKVFVEERIKIHPKFLRFTKLGAPDIRVIVFNQVPIMAMLRIPTEESGGKANISHGAVGLGIDLTTGITTFGVCDDHLIKEIYDRKRKKKIKVNGIKVPYWEKILKTAVFCQKVVPGLGYVGVDIILDKYRGPMVLELNARPGLSIQICNRAGLKKRLDRIEGLKVRDIDHGIKIAQSLFGETFVDRVRPETEIKVLSLLEAVRIKTGLESPKKMDLIAKIDTGAYRSSIDKEAAKSMGLLKRDNVLYYRHYRSAIGKGKRRPVISVTFWLRGRKIVTAANVTNRKKLRTKFLIGRKDLMDFMVRIGE